MFGAAWKSLGPPNSRHWAMERAAEEGTLPHEPLQSKNLWRRSTDDRTVRGDSATNNQFAPTREGTTMLAEIFMLMLRFRTTLQNRASNRPLPPHGDPRAVPRALPPRCARST